MSRCELTGVPGDFAQVADGICLSLDETTTKEDVNQILNVFAAAKVRQHRCLVCSHRLRVH